MKVLTDDQIREFIEPFGNQAQVVGARRVELFERVRKVAAAFGGCTNCYGKGYATVHEFTSGHDTDQDIGSPGGTFKIKNDVMRFCDCPRGKQLQELLNESRA